MAPPILSPSRSGRFKDLLLLLLISGVVFLTNLGAARLWDRDEPRNAGCAAEMLARHDWITPIFNDEMRGQKPVLLYWLMMSAYQVFGVNEFSARLWSALLGMGTVGLTYMLGRHLLGRSAGIWSGVVLTTTLMFTVASRAATPDAPLIFFSTLSLTLYVLLTFRSQEDLAVNLGTVQKTSLLRQPGVWFPRGWGAVAVFSAMSLGVLAKGPIAAVLPSCIIGLLMMVQNLPTSSSAPWKRWIGLLDPRLFFRCFWRMQPWFLLATVLLIAAPWFFWVGVRTEGDFIQWFFFREHLGRATTAMENHTGGIWFYPVAILVGFFPWSILAVPTAIGVTRSLRSQELSPMERLGLVLSIVWVLLQVSVFTAVQTKLPSYVTPCYPAVAVMVGFFVARWSAGQLLCREFWIRGGYVSMALVGVAILIGLPLATRELNIQGAWLGAIGLVPLISGLWGLLASWHSTVSWRPAVLAVGNWLFVVLFFGLGTVTVDQNRETQRLWDYVQAHQSRGTRLGSYRCLESSWVFYAGQPIWELTTNPMTAAGKTVSTINPVQQVSHQEFHVEESDRRVDPLQREHDWDPKPTPYVSNFISGYPDSFIVVPETHLAELLQQLPQGYREVARCRQFLKDGYLVLVGRAPVEIPHLKSPPPRQDSLGSPTPSHQASFQGR